MADDAAAVVAAQAAADAKAAADTAALKTAVEGAVRSSIEALTKESLAKQAEIDAAKAAEGKEPKPGAFDDMFRPSLEPAIKAGKDAEVAAAMAEDAVAFYTDPANASVLRHRTRIEQTVKDQRKRGNLISRKDAWNWLRGGDLYDELSKESLTAHEAKLEEARKAQTAGAGVTVPKFSKPFEQMETEELGKALGGVTF